MGTLDGLTGGVSGKFEVAGAMAALALDKIVVGHLLAPMRQDRRNQKFAASVVSID
jgi:hypothetical protein